MRFVAIKTAPQQAAVGIHRVRDLRMKQHTMLRNQLRGLMGEFGVVAAKGKRGLSALLAILADADAQRIPSRLRAALLLIAERGRRLAAVDNQLVAAGPSDHRTRRRADPVERHVGDRHRSRRLPQGRRLRRLGLVPRQEGTGGKVWLGPISKRGNGYLRRLLVNGATAVLNSKRAKEDPWLVELLATKPRKVVAVALANKMARPSWALMMRQENDRDMPAAA